MAPPGAQKKKKEKKAWAGVAPGGGAGMDLGRWRAWRAVAVAVLAAAVALRFVAGLAWPAAPAPGVRAGAPGAPGEAAPGEVAPRGTRRGSGDGRSDRGGGGGGGGAAPGRGAGGLTVASLVLEDQRCTDPLDVPAGRMPELMTVRVFNATTYDGMSWEEMEGKWNWENQDQSRWYPHQYPFARPFAVDDAEGGLIGLSQGGMLTSQNAPLGDPLRGGGVTFDLSGSIVETVPYYSHSDCSVLLLETSVEKVDEFMKVTFLKLTGRRPPYEDKKVTGTYKRQGKLRSGVVQMMCRYVVDVGEIPSRGQCFGTYSFRNQNLPDGYDDLPYYFKKGVTNRPNFYQSGVGPGIGWSYVNETDVE